MLMMNIKKFEKDMAVFSFSQHQDVLTYLVHLEVKGWTIEDTKKWLKKKRKQLTQNKAISSLLKQCPLCQAPMSLLPLNFNRATVTGEDSQSVWLCSNQECLNTIYNKETTVELRSKGGTLQGRNLNGWNRIRIIFTK